MVSKWSARLIWTSKCLISGERPKIHVLCIISSLTFIHFRHRCKRLIGVVHWKPLKVTEDYLPFHHRGQSISEKKPKRHFNLRVANSNDPPTSDSNWSIAATMPVHWEQYYSRGAPFQRVPLSGGSSAESMPSSTGEQRFAQLMAISLQNFSFWINMRSALFRTKMLRWKKFRRRSVPGLRWVGRPFFLRLRDIKQCGSFIKSSPWNLLPGSIFC